MGLAAAKARSKDYIQSFRFQVVESPGSWGAFIDTSVVAGFKSVTLPDISTAAVEYRDGLTVWTVKQPGIPTVGNSTMQKGVVSTVSDFYDWAIATCTGDEYRTHLQIQVKENANTATPKTIKEVIMYEAFPTRIKPVGDLDATNAEINLKELEVACERIEEKNGTV